MGTGHKFIVIEEEVINLAVLSACIISEHLHSS